MLVILIHCIFTINRSLTILNDEDEDELDDKFNGNGFLSIGGSDYYSRTGNGFEQNDNLHEESSEPYDLRYHHTFASLPVDQSHVSSF